MWYFIPLKVMSDDSGIKRESHPKFQVNLVLPYHHNKHPIICVKAVMSQTIQTPGEVR